jgi:hypothetical protein
MVRKRQKLTDSSKNNTTTKTMDLMVSNVQVLDKIISTSESSKKKQGNIDYLKECLYCPGN